MISVLPLGLLVSFFLPLFIEVNFTSNLLEVKFCQGNLFPSFASESWTRGKFSLTNFKKLQIQTLTATPYLLLFVYFSRFPSLEHSGKFSQVLFKLSLLDGDSFRVYNSIVEDKSNWVKPSVLQIASITWIQCTSYDWSHLIFDGLPFHKKKILIALFKTLLLTSIKPKFVDYFLHNQRLNFIKKF